MKRSIVIIVIVVVALLILAGVRQIRKSQEELAKSITQIQEEIGVPVEVTEISLGTFTLSRTYLGTVEGALQNSVSASIVEEIVAIPVKVGDMVKKDQIVCRLDSKASMAGNRQLKMAYEDAKLDAARMEKLYATGAVSKQMMEKAQLSRDVARENFETSSQTVSLVAPFDGIITEIYYRPGESTKMGEPVVKIADLHRVSIKFSVNFDDWKRIDNNTSVFLQINGDGTTEIPAKITDISISADPENRLFSVRVEADNGNKLLQPGLLVDTRVVVSNKPDVVLVSRDAVISRNDINGVFLVNENRRAVFTSFSQGEANSAVIEVKEGLSPGEIIVIYGHNSLEDGDLVNIVES